jgi:hypothetical protein
MVAAYVPVQPPHHLGGVPARQSDHVTTSILYISVSARRRGKSRSLFVATPLSEFRLPARSRFGEGRGALHQGILEQSMKIDFV